MDAPVVAVLAFFAFFICITAGAEPRVVATAPVHPVKEHAVLSFHCQIWNLNEDIHEVTISRQRGQFNERLSWNKAVLENVNDRVFLALRLLEDGSSVYFLTIIDVVASGEESDEGQYWCNVMQRTNDGGMAAVAKAQVAIRLQYFPSEIYPACESSVSTMNVAEGTLVTLNCISEEANPVTSLTWSRTGKPVSDEESVRFSHENGMVTSVMSLRLSRDDKDTIFMCHLKSVAFPDKSPSCHIGPFNIIFDPNSQHGLNTPKKPPKDTTIPDTTSAPHRPERPPIERPDCSKRCPILSSPVNYWIMATIVAFLVAIIFFLVAIAIAVKLHRKTAAERQEYVQAVLGGGAPPGEHMIPDDIYEKLRYRTDTDRVYMALDKAIAVNKPGSLIVATPRGGLDIEYTYTGTPTGRN